MISSYCCICNKKQQFKIYIKYFNELVFKNYNGISLYRCINCGVLKSISSKKNIINPKQSRVRLFESKQLDYKDKFKFLVASLQQYKKSGKILDVGCSSGILLKLLQDLGYEVFGIEPNYKAYLEAKKKLGGRIYKGKIEEYIIKNKSKFDIIIYNHVLEHVNNPRKELKLAGEVLKKNGLFVFGLPNTSNIIFYLRSKYWESLMAREHIWHFSKKQFIDLLTDLNIAVKQVYYSNHDRNDYPLLKRLYFYLLVILNRLFKTGEAMLILAFKKQDNKL
ncbi:MAG: class I SAM-dependent methyltransferase [bacterium]